VQPKKVSERTSPLPPIAAAKYFVDCPPFSLSSHSTRYSSAYGYGSSYKHGMEFYGIIVSVFGADKSLLFQGASVPRLCSMGPTTCPQSPDLEELRARHESTMRTLNQARDAFFMNRTPDNERLFREAREASNAAREAFHAARDRPGGGGM
jgi:hypothetical protein